MEYQVPQFIEVEDKLIGPLTFKQFLYIAGGGGICIISFFYLPILLALLVSLGAVALAGALAFYKVNGKSFIDMLEVGFNYYVGAKFFLWQHKDRKPSETQEASVVAPTGPVRATPRLTSGKLSELAWSLDMKQHPPDDHPK